MAGHFSNIVIGWDGKDYGDIVFLDKKWVMIRAYYDDRDANEDGNISYYEKSVWFASPWTFSGFQLARVGYTATFDYRVARMDSSFMETGRKMQFAFAADCAVRAVEAKLLKPNAGKLANMLVDGCVRQWCVRKGAEELVAQTVNLMR